MAAGVCGHRRLFCLLGNSGKEEGRHGKDADVLHGFSIGDYRKKKGMVDILENFCYNPNMRKLIPVFCNSVLRMKNLHEKGRIVWRYLI